MTKKGKGKQKEETSVEYKEVISGEKEDDWVHNKRVLNVMNFTHISDHNNR